MEYLKIAESSIFSIVALFIIAKFIGNRQISQLTVFDYVNSITIGSIAAEMATELDKHWSKPLLSMIIYGLATAAISYICSKSLKMRRALNGRSIILFNDGKFLYKGMKRARLDINEFLSQCRISGYFNLNDIQTAIMEQNGKVSFLPKAESRTVTTKDMALVVPPSTLWTNVISDGQILEQNLLSAGFDKRWLLNKLKVAGSYKAEDVMLATVDKTGSVIVYPKKNIDIKNDIFI